MAKMQKWTVQAKACLQRAIAGAASAIANVKIAVELIAPNTKGTAEDRKAAIQKECRLLVGDSVKYATIRSYVSQMSAIVLAPKGTTWEKPRRVTKGKGKNKKTVTVYDKLPLADAKTAREVAEASRAANAALGIQPRGTSGGKQSDAPSQEVVRSFGEQFMEKASTPSGLAELQTLAQRAGFELRPIAKVNAAPQDAPTVTARKGRKAKLPGRVTVSRKAGKANGATAH